MEKKNGCVHGIKRVWEWPHYFCRVRWALVSLLPSQPDGERGLPEDVCSYLLLLPQCSALQHPVGRPWLVLDKLIWWWCNAMSPVLVKSGDIGEAILVVVRCEQAAVLPSLAEPPPSTAQHFPWLPWLASARCRAGCTQSRCKQGFEKEAILKRQQCGVKSESLVSNCFGKNKKDKLSIQPGEANSQQNHAFLSLELLKMSFISRCAIRKSGC